MGGGAARIVALSGETAALVARAAEGVFDHPVEPAQLAAFLADPAHLMVLAVADGEVIGFASGVRVLHPDKAPQLFVNEVGVAPPHQGGGLGRRLVAALLDAGRARGCTVAWVGTEPGNLAARRCYLAAGAGDPPEPFLLYEWDFAE